MRVAINDVWPLEWIRNVRSLVHFVYRSIAVVQSDRTWDRDARPRWKAIEEKKAGKNSPSEEVVSSSSCHLDVVSASSIISTPFCCFHLVDFEGPLGFRAGVELPARGDLSAFLRYATLSDRFVDTFADTGYTHHAAPPFFSYNMNLSLEEAFFSAPRRLANRTRVSGFCSVCTFLVQMMWEPNNWVTPEEFQPVFCRGMLYCIDVMSSIPQIRLLEPRDQVRMMVGRGIQTGEVIVLQRTLRITKKRCILIAGGTYLPLEADELVRYKPARRATTL